MVSRKTLDGAPARGQWLDEQRPMLALGMDKRRKVMGAEHVARSLASADGNSLQQKLQQCVIELAWGGVWGRPGLDLKSRSLATLSVLLALGHLEEFTLHLRGALRNGWTPDELAEAIIQIACYAGWPAAVRGFRVAGDVFEQSATASGSTRGDKKVAKSRAERTVTHRRK